MHLHSRIAQAQHMAELSLSGVVLQTKPHTPGRHVALWRTSVVRGIASLAEQVFSLIGAVASGSPLVVRRWGALPLWQRTREPSAAALPAWQTPQRQTWRALPASRAPTVRRWRALPHGQQAVFSPFSPLPAWQTPQRPALNALPAVDQPQPYETSTMGYDKSLHQPAVCLGRSESSLGLLPRRR